MTEIARRARLVFARATIPPNFSISGSFWNWGAPPDREMAVAIVSAPSRHATSIATNAAIQSVAPGRPAKRSEAVEDHERHRRDEREIGEVEGDLHDRLASRHEQGDRRSGQHGQQVFLRGHEEESEDRRDLAQGERVGLTPEVDEDDLGLGDDEGGRQQWPRH